ncbi:MAG TPA: hypothetical protein VKB86_10770 [Pyrinomonadaceae bacterium]|nr:hypothetical protein [Pyrinomonadaceae bacterium]
MKNPNFFRSHARSVILSVVASFASLVIISQSAFAMGWNGIEPLKSRRADVERILGKPLVDQPGEEGTLRFHVNGGVVTISFVTARLVANKKLNPDYEGTVLEIVLQHTNSSDTPETLTISGNSKFDREHAKGGEIYRNLKDGIIYTFVEGRLDTTRFTPAATQWARARKG